MEQDLIKIELNGEPQHLNMLLGGGINKDDHPTAFYAGDFSPEKMGIALMHILRAVIKSQREVLEVPLERSEDFILFCLAEAMRRERIDRHKSSEESDTIMSMTKIEK